MSANALDQSNVRENRHLDEVTPRVTLKKIIQRNCCTHIIHIPFCDDILDPVVALPPPPPPPLVASDRKSN